MRVVVAMSGGVDSSVAAGLLVEQGHDVIGVHMKLHDVPDGAAKDKHCCGLEDALDARRVADALGIPFYVMDLRAPFKAAVMDYFADSYLKGQTPNPCISCNGVLKFRVLMNRAKSLGATHLATGHYARCTEQGALHQAVDQDKDQSYFLFPVTREALTQTIFPLGGLTKPEVRAFASRFMLPNADKPESQEVCFIPDDDHTRFVSEHRPGRQGAGEIVSEDGTVLGHHPAYWKYTVGQRRGLGVATGKPLYVLRVEPETCRVVVGPVERLDHQEVVITGTNWFRPPGVDEDLKARIRHRGELVSCTVSGEEPAQVRFPVPVLAAAPGQALVVYAGDEVVGGGWISEVKT